MASDRPSLTSRQREAFGFIVSYMKRYTRPPTLHEIGDALGVRSINSVVKLTAILERKGYLVREAGRARGIRLTDVPGDLPDDASPYRLLSIRDARMDTFIHPLPGWTDSVCVDQRFFRGVSQPATCFVSRIADNGMAMDGLRRSDLIVVEPVDPERLLHGDLVACVFENEFLARRVVESGSTRQLVAVDRTYPPIPVRSDDGVPCIRGRILGVMRRL